MFQCDVIMTIGLWRHSGGPIYNALFLMKASNVNSDVANNFDWNEAPWLQARDTENKISRRASYGQYDRLELANRGIKVEIVVWVTAMISFPYLLMMYSFIELNVFK